MVNVLSDNIESIDEVIKVVYFIDYPSNELACYYKELGYEICVIHA